jgi:hypothetical protein
MVTISLVVGALAWLAFLSFLGGEIIQDFRKKLGTDSKLVLGFVLVTISLAMQVITIAQHTGVLNWSKEIICGQTQEQEE